MIASEAFCHIFRSSCKSFGCSNARIGSFLVRNIRSEWSDLIWANFGLDEIWPSQIWCFLIHDPPDLNTSNGCFLAVHGTEYLDCVKMWKQWVNLDTSIKLVLVMSSPWSFPSNKLVTWSAMNNQRARSWHNGSDDSSREPLLWQGMALNKMVEICQATSK